jgi:hypothetical protein
VTRFSAARRLYCFQVSGSNAGGGTFVGAVSISRTVVLTAVRISRSVNGASRARLRLGVEKAVHHWDDDGYPVRSSAMYDSQSPVVSEFENLLPL